MQKKIPAWAPSQRRWPKGFTAHRDGWIKSYRGKTIWVGGKTVDVADLPKLFEAKTKIADAKPLDELPTAVGLTYAELLGAFLAYKEHEVAPVFFLLYADRLFQNQVVDVLWRHHAASACCTGSRSVNALQLAVFNQRDNGTRADRLPEPVG